MRALRLWQRTLPWQEHHCWAAAWAGHPSQDSYLPQQGALLWWEMWRLGNVLPPQSLSSGACPVAADDLCHLQPPTCHSLLLNLHPWAKISVVEDSSEYTLSLNAKCKKDNEKKSKLNSLPTFALKITYLNSTV